MALLSGHLGYTLQFYVKCSLCTRCMSHKDTVHCLSISVQLYDSPVCRTVLLLGLELLSSEACLDRINVFPVNYISRHVVPRGLTLQLWNTAVLALSGARSCTSVATQACWQKGVHCHCQQQQHRRFVQNVSNPPATISTIRSSSSHSLQQSLQRFICSLLYSLICLSIALP